MMSVSDGAADFIGAVFLFVFVFEAIFVFVVGGVHAAATTRNETSARIFFMTGLLHSGFGKTCDVLLCQNGERVKSNVQSNLQNPNVGAGRGHPSALSAK